MKSALWRAFLLVVLISFLPGASPGQNSNEQGPTILFVCEHGAAKSVIAAAYFDKLAKERGLHYKALFRGTNPDPALSAVAEKGLKEDGLDTRGWQPKLVSQQEMKEAAQIVTLGCTLPNEETVSGKLAKWNEIPSVSQNYQAARDEIVKNVQALVDELAKKQAPRKQRPRP
jgi:protein-tyrosine-phosphatase